MKIVKIPRKGSRFECDSYSGICALPAISNTIANIILESIKEHLDRQSSLVSALNSPALDTSNLSNYFGTVYGVKISISHGIKSYYQSDIEPQKMSRVVSR